MKPVPRPTLSIAGSLCLLALSTAAGGGGQVDYWPFKVGNSWTMPTTIGSTAITQVISVTKVTKANGTTTATLDYTANGAVVQTEIYNSNDKGLWRVASSQGAAGKINPPLPVILLPLTAGKSWRWKGTVDKQGMKIPGSAILTVAETEPIKWQGGTLKAVRVHLDLTVTAQGQTITIPNDYWFAPNVGMVRQRAQIGKTIIDGTVSSYSLKK